MAEDRYTTSFTTGSLFRHESVILAELYLLHGNWTETRNEVVAKNLLQARTLKTLKNVCSEVIKRLNNLQPKELELLITSNHQEQTQLLWIAACRQYKFIRDFATEVLREGYISLKTDLSYEDFDAFFNRKAEWHAELEAVRPTTRKKLRQVLFKMLREADLLDSQNTINKAILNPVLIELLTRNNPQEIRYFPVFESDLMGM